MSELIEGNDLPLGQSFNDAIVDTETKSNQPNNSFKSVLQAWAEIDLPSLQKKLDEQGLSLKDEQKGSLLSRKHLALKTKEFKKLADEDKLLQVNALIKLYQNEIDSLNNKKKNVENTFFGFYRSIAEAPDPRPALEASLESVILATDSESLKLEVNRLSEELFKKADYDQLKERLIENEQKSSKILALRLSAQEKEFKALIDEKEKNWAEKEKELQRQVRDSREVIEELKASNEVTELKLNKHNKQKDDNEFHASASTLAELDIVYRDAEAAKKRVMELEKRNEALRRDLSASQSDTEGKKIQEELNKRISDLESENALLVANLDQQRRKAVQTSEEKQSSLDIYEREIGVLKGELTNLKKRLDKVSDYDELKHELLLLRQIEFGEEELETVEYADGFTGIDSLVLKKNRELTEELANLRSEYDSKSSKIEHLEKEIQKSNVELVNLNNLNRKLESDLSTFQEASGAQGFSDTLSVLSTFSKVTANRSKSDQAANEESSILPIITKQRDRFRDRINELEDELKKQYSLTSDLRRQMNKLKLDNEDLYEKTRFLTSFNDKGISKSSESKFFKSRSNNFDLERNPYKDVYESKLHPIEQFRVREQERITSQLSPIDRMFISFTRAVLATKATRTLFLLYCLTLHGVVMSITIYAMNLHTSMIPEVSVDSNTAA